MAEPVRVDSENIIGSRGGAMAWCEYAATRLAMGGASRLPHSWQRVLTGALARLAVRVDQRHTNAARSYLRQALGPAASEEEERRRIVQAYRHLFQISLDSAAFERRVPQERLLEHYTLHRSDVFLEAIASGRGGILVAPHLGDWEAGSAIMPHIGMVPSYAVSRPVKNRYLSRHFLEVRKRRGLTLIPRRGGMTQVARILEEGGWIAMLLDQRPSGRHVLAPFFGRTAPCERGAAVLIKRLRVPLVFCACYLTERPFQYDIFFERLLTAEDIAPLSVEEITARINREMERLILHRPEQYFWLHDRFRGAPAIESP